MKQEKVKSNEKEIQDANISGLNVCVEFNQLFLGGKRGGFILIKTVCNIMNGTGISLCKYRIVEKVVR